MSEHSSPGASRTEPDGPEPAGSTPFDGPSSFDGSTQFGGSTPFGNSTDWAPPGSDPSGGTPRPLRRSRTDRKVAGLAGGIGRALGIDPVLLRVALVVLTLFGGVGIVLYAVGWLIVADDGDQVSAVQSLLGRGRSSVSPALTVLLALIALGAAGTVLSIGVSFLPLVIAAGLIWWFGFSRRGCRRRWNNHAERDARGWPDRSERWGQRADRIGEQARQWGERAERWVHAQGWADGQGGSDRGRGGDPETGPGRNGNGAPGYSGHGGGAGDAAEGSPFARPPFWERPAEASTRVRMTKEPTAGGTDTRAPAADRAEHPTPGPDQFDPAQFDPAGGRTTPPAWDPLGAAPFAWDLPEPAPLAPPTPVRRRGGAVAARVTTGLAVLTMAGVSAGLLAGWWTATWAVVSALGLSVVAVGMLVTALAGRGVRGLVGPAVILSVLTLGLSVSGLSGTTGYGDVSWTPTGADLQNTYTVQAGSGTLDLTGIAPTAGQTDATQLTVRAGQATVRLPADATVDLSCRVSAGQADCLDTTVSGINREASTSYAGAAGRGTLKVVVQVDGGYAQVTRG